MQLSIIVLIWISSIVTAEVTMMVVYGKPNSVKNADISLNTDWSACLSLCYYSITCILAWKNGTSCVRFNYTATGPVTQLSNGTIVAFKVDKPNDQCPSGKNPPTFNNKNATGSLYITDLNAANKATLVTYTIYLAGITWNFTYSYNTSCPDQFISVIRSNGSIVCFKQWISTDAGGFTYDHALSLCTNVSASLAGINSQEDLNYMTQMVQELRYQVNASNTYARIDGKRTTACQSTPSKSTCQTVNGFTFTSTIGQNFSYYNWTTSVSAQETPNDNCIVLVANGTNPLKADIRSCLLDSPLQPYIVFCAKPAWIG